MFSVKDELGHSSPTFAICLAYHPGLGIDATMLKWGERRRVESYAQDIRKVYLSHGFTQEAEEIVVISPVTEEQIQACVDSVGAVAKLYRTVMSPTPIKEKAREG